MNLSAEYRDPLDIQRSLAGPLKALTNLWSGL